MTLVFDFRRNSTAVPIQICHGIVADVGHLSMGISFLPLIFHLPGGMGRGAGLRADSRFILDLLYVFALVHFRSMDLVWGLC